jgi:DNA-binding transcriptional LysR family regulator
VRLGSFARAAEVIGITQPALSKSMRTLELELDVTLLERGPSGVFPTPFGRILVEQAGRSCTDIDRAVREIGALKGSGRGLVQVGGSTTVMRLFLPRILRRMRGSENEAEIVVMEGLRDELLTALRNGRLDVALSLTPDPAVAAEFRVEALLNDDIAFVVRRRHPLAGRGIVRFEDLCDYRWIMPSSYESERKDLAQRFQSRGLPAPNVAVQTSSSAIMTSLLRETDHVSYLPRTLLRLGDLARDLHQLPIETGMRGPDICLITRRSGVVLPPVRAFVAATREIMGEVRDMLDGAA